LYKIEKREEKRGLT